MVVRQSARLDLTDAQVDRMFRALADATRRDIVARTLVADTSVSTLAAAYAMSFAAVQRHVAVLEEAGLVRKNPRGRERLVQAVPDQLARARTLLARLEELWGARLSQLDDILAEPSRIPASVSASPPTGSVDTPPERTDAEPADPPRPDPNPS